LSQFQDQSSNLKNQYIQNNYIINEIHNMIKLFDYNAKNLLLN